MISKIFGRSSKPDTEVGSPPRKDRVRGRSLSLRKQNDDPHPVTSRLGDIRGNMDPERYVSGMPTAKAGFADKLDSHQRGASVKYAVIGNPPSAARDGFMSRLRGYKPQTSTSAQSLQDIPAIRLIGDATAFPLSDATAWAAPQKGKDFVLIDSILVHFIPLDSFINDKCVVTVQINDFRKSVATVVRSARVDSTMGYNILFTLDYCIEVQDMSRMSISFACPGLDFEEGISWGTVKLVAQLSYMSFPKRMPFIETMGCCIMSDTDLNDFEFDPRELDLVLTPLALDKLRSAMKRGEIENLTLPRDDGFEISTARTVLGGTLEDEPFDRATAIMKTAALHKAVATGRLGVDQPPQKSIMKTPANLVQYRVDTDPNSPMDGESDRGKPIEGVSELESVKMEESDTESQDSVVVKAPPGPKTPERKITRFEG